MKKPCRGFTLIEILIAISIMGIILGFSLTQYQRFNRRQVFQQAVEEVKSGLHLAQDKALSGERPHSGWCPSPNTLEGHRFTLDLSSYSIEAICSGGSDPWSIKTGNLPGSGEVVVVNPTSVTFNVLGLGIGETPPVAFDLIGFGSSLYTESITVRVTGKIE